ncbi:hypothetical protein BG842_02695 [Haladaptatus sp. W1]|nr:hypothetical protein BG842_02695 [Haladaptatus sp. W1]
MIGWPRRIFTKRWSSGWWMEMISCIVRIPMSIPATLPGAGSVHFSIVNFEVVVRVPPDSERRLIHQHWIIRLGECNAKFEMAIRISDDCLFDLLCGDEPGL